MTLFIGIDIGLGGALACYDAEKRTLIGLDDMPVDQVTVGKNVRGRVAVSRLLELLPDKYGHAVLERPEARPMRSRDRQTGQILLRQPGAAGMLAFGESYGVVYAACIAKGMQVTEVRPGSWKRSMGVSGDKDEARRRAVELFPGFARAFARKKDDGRAEAALLALWLSERGG